MKKTFRFTIALFVVIATSSIEADTTDWNRQLEQWTADSEVVFLGKLIEIHSKKEGESEPFITVATMKVDRYLKGVSEEYQINVEFHTSGPYQHKADTEKVVYFCKKRLENNRLLMHPFRWSGNSWRSVEQVIFRTDKETRIPGMAKPLKPDQEITLSLGIDDGRGKALSTIIVSDFKDIRLLVQFENHDKANHTVMPCLDGSIVNWRYPYYNLEVIDANDKPVPQRPISRCGNVNPWRAQDFIDLAKGNVFRSRMETYPYWELTSGRYKLRLKYTAKRDLNLKRLGFKSEPVDNLMKNVWEGTLYSNWVFVEITKTDGP